MTTYVYSAKSNAFYFYDFQSDYEKAGTWPDDAVDVDDSIYVEFAANQPPEGKTRAAGTDGLPVWVDIPAPTSKQILESNIRVRNRLMRMCTDAAFPLQSALTRGVATSEQQNQLIEIEDFSIKLMNEVDWTASPLQLPPAPELFTSPAI
ncbi:tail fiber assembly protein [Salmonella enterica]|nr:tail fiber assembly protein [Salmonella enterica]